MSLSERLHAKHEARMKAIRDYNAAIDYAHDEGIQDGYNTGYEKGYRGQL